MSHPVYMFPMLNWTLRRVQRELFDELGVGSEKAHVRFRVPLLDMSFLFETKALPRSREVGKFVCLQGTVIRTGMLKTLEYERAFECTKCRYVFTVQADVEQYHMFPEPATCPAMNDPPCKGRKFRYVDGTAKHKDYQEIKVQEKMLHLQQGQMPKSMIIILEDDLVDSCKGGDDVILTGVVMRRWRPLQSQLRCDVAIVVVAHGIYVQNEEDRASVVTPEQRAFFDAHWRQYRDERAAELRGRDRLLYAMCPTAHGMYVVKLAMLLVLIGGVETIDANCTKVRGESHMLLIGDPGVAKSQFLGFAAKIAPRSVRTTGVGTTGAGLTVAAVRDQSGDWVLEAGALVLADGGVCCIDEFAQIRPVDRATIHEAMEQQTISVAKAGLVTKLQTRCTVIAACNPKGRYDTSRSLEENVGLASPLLSRFDVIFLLKDDHDPHWDSEVADFVLREHMTAGNVGALPSDSHSPSQAATAQHDVADTEWTFELLQAYVQHVRRLYRPTMSPEARQVISAYYRKQRQLGMRAASRTTIRMLESLVRLAQAHARLMARNVVALIDAVVVVLIVETSMAGAAIQDFVSPVRTIFNSDPDELFRAQLVPQVLQMLDLGHMLGVPIQSHSHAPPPPPTQRGGAGAGGGATQRPPSTFDVFAEDLDDDDLSSDDAPPPVVPISIDEPPMAVEQPPPPPVNDVADDNDDDDNNDDNGDLSAHSQLRRAELIADVADDKNNADDNAMTAKMNVDDASSQQPPPPPVVQAATFSSNALGDALARVRAASSLISHSNPNSQGGDGSSRGSMRRKRLLNDENDKQ